VSDRPTYHPTLVLGGFAVYLKGGRLDEFSSDDGRYVINGHVVTDEQFKRGWVEVLEGGTCR
jgi:leucyl aminopeptidase (aminopeptidase T)